MNSDDYVVIGRGTVGLATALCNRRRFCGFRLLRNKEADVSLHKTGGDSGVIISEIYDKPGGFKARLSQAGRRAIVAFCRKQEIEARQQI